MSWSRTTGRDNKAPRKKASSLKKKSISAITREALLGGGKCNKIKKRKEEKDKNDNDNDGWD